MDLAQAYSDFYIGRPNLCLIFNSKKMKKVILVSIYIITCVVMISCTNNEVPANQNKTAATTNTQLTDGQSNPPPITPPRP